MLSWCFVSWTYMLIQLVTAISLAVFSASSAHSQTTSAQKSTVPAAADASHKGDVARLAQKKSEDQFNGADEDRDGQLSRAEVAKHLPYIDTNFLRYDKNKDGFLSWEEFVGHDRWKRQPKE